MNLIGMITMIIIGMITNHYDYWDDEWMMVIFFGDYEYYLDDCHYYHDYYDYWDYENNY